MKEIKISTEYITLGQFLKFSGVVLNGGEAKSFIANSTIKVNDQIVKERGKKLRNGDLIEIHKEKYVIRN